MSDGLVVGTYLAEQVALTSYALLSVSQADAKRSQISAVPSGPRVKRRLRDHNNFKADTLPALVSLDPLLQGATTAVEGPGPTAAAETQRRMRLTHIEISSARLAEGRQTWSTDRPTADQPPSRGDCQAIASLTAPLPWFRPGAPEPKKSLKKARSRRGSAGFSSTTNPWDLFSESLRGTGVERSPRKRSPSPPRKRDAGERAPRDLFHFGLAEQPLLPEDAVQAYFESEKARTDQLHEKEKEPKELEKVDGQRRYAIVKPLPHSDKVHREPLRVLRESKKSEPADPLMEGDALDRTKFFAELLDQMFFKQKFSPVRRDACQLTRMPHSCMQLQGSAKMDDGSVEDGEGGRRNWVGPKLLVRPFFCQLLAALSVFDLALRLYLYWCWHQLVRASGELFPAEHLSKALKGVESAVVRPAITRLEAESGASAATGSADARKQRLRAQCGALHRQLMDKKANEDGFLSNVMTFFREEDAKAMNHRMQIQDQLDQFEELRAHQAQQAKEEEALK
ncbi:unnamed protein product, partial [Symbiodinium necroappetens]